MTEEKVVGVKSAALVLGVTERTVFRWLKLNKIPKPVLELRQNLESQATHATYVWSMNDLCHVSDKIEKLGKTSFHQQSVKL